MSSCVVHLRVAAALAVLPRAANRIYLVHEDDRGGVLSRHHEELTHHARALANVLLHQLGARDADKGAVCAERETGVMGEGWGEGWGEG